MITHAAIAEALAVGTGRPPLVPTPEQRAIIEAPDAPSLVIAGAGSGKTHTMALRILWLIASRDVAPSSILGLTFTRKAAGELRDRVAASLAKLRGAGLIAFDELDEPEISTYNSYANAVCREHGLVVGMEPDATLLDEATAWLLMRRVVAASDDERLAATDATVSTLVNRALELAGAARDNRVPLERLDAFAREFAAITELPGKAGGSSYVDIPKLASTIGELAPLADLVRAFEREKRDRGLIDFADQVAGAAEICASAPAIAAELRRRAAHVVLDEYQDTSAGQVRFLASVFRDAPVMAVGDPKQAIYSWRGASVGTMSRFHDAFSTSAVVGERERTFTLRTSWRNDRVILDAANEIAGRLDGVEREQGLVARDGAGPGRLDVLAFEREDEESAACARRCRELLDAARKEGAEPPSIAMLVRVRTMMPRLSDALAEEGVPHRVLGLGGVLSTPEVVDLVALLRIVHDPGAGSEVLRILAGARFRIGLGDLAALHRLAVALAARDWSLEPVELPALPAGELPAEEDGASLLEALEVVARLPDGHALLRELTPEAVVRLREAAALLDGLRDLGRLPVVDLVDETIRRARLDLEVEANPRNAARQRNLDAFVAAVQSAAGQRGEGGIAAVLDWLDAKAGSDDLAPVREKPEPGTVQMLTVHGAKGLEWDHVIIPGMLEGKFPTPSKDSNGWLSSGKLPYELREDARDLPELRWRDAESQKELLELRATFKEDVRDAHDEEERRLAYVALTRAKRSLVLTAATWTPLAKKPRAWSRFLEELASAGLAPELPEYATELDGATGERADRPAPEWPVSEHPEWPKAPMADAAQRRARELGDRVIAELDRVGGDRAKLETTRWDDAIDLLVAEAAERGAPTPLHLPDRLAASRFKDAVLEPRAVANAALRPMPERPHRTTRIGTMFHAWVEAQLGGASARGDELDDADLGLADEDRELLGLDAPSETDRAALEALQAAFLATPWASRTPIAVEQRIELPLGERTIVCKLDAVFEREDGTIEVVDWKTGRVPAGEAAVAERQLQLALYAHAWAHRTGASLERIRAVLVYVGAGVELASDRIESEAELIARLDTADAALAEASVTDSSLTGASLADASLTDPSAAGASLADASLAGPSAAGSSLADSSLAERREA